MLIKITTIAAGLLTTQLRADSFFFSTGDPDGRIATASRLPSPGKIEVETADDFVTTASSTVLTGATFTGLLPAGVPLSDIAQVEVEFYHVFPIDSAFPPSGNVPTRVNSPSDVAFDGRALGDGNLTFTSTLLSANFTAANSVINGIHPSPNQTTGGEGSVSGQEVEIDVVFTTPVDLPASHYFFKPSVELASGNFLWLSAPKPIVAPGTPFPPGSSDLQSWIRNEDLAPDWLRVGTDIVGPGNAFNAAFSLSGHVPDSSPSPLLFGIASLALISVRAYFRKKQRCRIITAEVTS